MELKKSIKDKALEVGFDVVGFTDTKIDEQTKNNFKRFLRENRHGNMDWMAKNADRRASPIELWPGVKSIIVVGLNYGQADSPVEALRQKDRGNISVYARGEDYHKLVKKRLKQIGQWLVKTYPCEIKVFVDTAPVLEKPLAQKAGLGWQGKHTNLVSPFFGSWLFLGEIYTDLVIEPDTPTTDQCGTCRACIDACPTGALDIPYQIDARRCISYLTIEEKAEIPEALADTMGNHVYGCDDCLSACPWNKFSRITKEKSLLSKTEFNMPKLSKLSKLSDTDFRQLFSGSAIKQTGRNRFIRNIMIAIANSGDKNLLRCLYPHLKDESTIIASTAKWAINKLRGQAFFCREHK